MIATLGRTAALRLLLRAAQGSAVGDRAGTARFVLSDARLHSFARGLSFGALVGAAIAGLGVWTRLRSRPS